MHVNATQIAADAFFGQPRFQLFQLLFIAARLPRNSCTVFALSCFELFLKPCWQETPWFWSVGVLPPWKNDKKNIKHSNWCGNICNCPIEYAASSRFHIVSQKASRKMKSSGEMRTLWLFARCRLPSFLAMVPYGPLFTSSWNAMG